VKLVFVNRFFHPDLAPTGRLAARVAFDLADRGREVHAVTSRQRYEDPAALLPAEEEAGGVRVHRVWTTRFGRAGLAGRALDYLTFYVSVTLALLARLRRGDVVVAMTDPPLLSVCVAFAAWLRGARLVNWLQDVFPETAERSGIRGMAGPVAALARGLRNWSLRRAADNVVLGERMAAELERLVPGARRTVAHNWADGGEILPLPAAESPLRKAWGLHGKFVVGYSGNFGRVHDAETLLAAARLLARDARIVFSVTGGGYRFGRVAKEGLPNVAVRGYLPHELLSEGLAACDVHLVTLLPAFEGLVVPSKFYSIAAAGRPVIFIGDRQGEVARLIAKHGCGLTIAPGDGVGLAAAIRELQDAPEMLRAMGERARAAFEREWDEPIALARWREVIGRAEKG
jgi:glycosyltransferase involved in cell wall biosynthesis